MTVTATAETLTQPITGDVEDAATGLGIFTPVSPLTGGTLQLDYARRVPLDDPDVTRLIDALPAEPPNPIPPRVVDTRPLAVRAWLALRRASRAVASTARETVAGAFHWLTTATPVAGPRVASWWRSYRRPARHAVRRSVLGRERSTMQCNAVTQRLRRARASVPPAEAELLPTPSAHDLVSWPEMYIEMMRGFNEIRHAPHGGYQFRC